MSDESECPSPPRLPVWVNSDPREAVAARGVIVVCAPGGEVFRAEVETKHAYCVFLRNRGPDKLGHISEDDKWPFQYFWLYGPRGW